MSLFDAYITLPTPPVPLFAELPDDLAGIERAIHNLYMRHDSIATVANMLWRQEGCPDGEAQHHNLPMKVKDAHWWEAEMMLEIVAETDAHTVWWAKSEASR